MFSGELALLALGAAVAGFVQGLSGFAFSMVAMSIWIWGIDPLTASVMAVSGALTGQILTAFSVKRSLRFQTLWPFLMGGFVGVPLGVAAIPLLDTNLFKLFFGIFLLVWCPTMLFAKFIPKITYNSKLADAAIGTVGGIMGGIGGFAGVIPTLWATLRELDKDEQRSIVQNFSLAALFMTMLVYVSLGRIHLDMSPKFAIVAVSLIVPSLLGSKLYLGLSDLAFKRLVLSLLTLSGLAMVLSAASKNL